MQHIWKVVGKSKSKCVCQKCDWSYFKETIQGTLEFCAWFYYGQIILFKKNDWNI